MSFDLLRGCHRGKLRRVSISHEGGMGMVWRWSAIEAETREEIIEISLLEEPIGEPPARRGVASDSPANAVGDLAH